MDSAFSDWWRAGTQSLVESGVKRLVEKRHTVIGGSGVQRLVEAVFRDWSERRSALGGEQNSVIGGKQCSGTGGKAAFTDW